MTKHFNSEKKRKRQKKKKKKEKRILQNYIQLTCLEGSSM